MAVSYLPTSFIHYGWRAEYVGDTTFTRPSDPVRNIATTQR
jgi:hypothetical protein